MRPNSRRPSQTSRKSSTRRSRTSSSTRRGEDDRRSRTSSSRRGSEDDRRGGRKPKKQDNTKLIIGMSVGAFLLLIIIIGVAASGGSKRTRTSGPTTSSKPKNTFTVPLGDRKKIFKEYIAGERKIEDEAAAKMDQLAGDERRKQGPTIQAEKRSKLSAFVADLSEKYRKKFPKASGTFVRKIINEGIKNDWR